MRSIETIYTAIYEMDHYLTWYDALHAELDVSDPVESDEEFSLTDWDTAVQGHPVEYYSDISVTLCTPEQAQLGPAHCKQFKAVVVVDGYVYGLESWEELDRLQQDWQSEEYCGQG